MTLILSDLTLSRQHFKEIFPLDIGHSSVAGGKRPGQTAGMARYTVLAGKNGREHIVELGYGTVPERSKKKQDYPLLLPKLDSHLAQFNIDGNTHNVLILKFLEGEGRKRTLQSFRNFNAPREIETTVGQPNEKLALAVLEIAALRIQDILNGKINVAQEPQVFINLIHHAIEMRAGHVLKKAVS